MKKFICFSARQKLFPGDTGYQAIDNRKLHFGAEGEPPRATCFPILPVINGYAEQGEEIDVLVFTENYDCGGTNCDLLDQNVKDLCNKKQVRLHNGQVTRVSVPLDDSVDSQLKLFTAMIDRIEDGDILYASLTYSSKVNILTALMCLRFARMAKRNTFIDCVVYGCMIFTTGQYGSKTLHKGEKFIYDITALVQLDDILRMVAASGAKDPVKMIRKLLDQMQLPDDSEVEEP